MLESLALRLFGQFLLPHVDSFASLKLAMRKSRMTQSLHEYLSIVVFMTALSFLSFLSLSLVLVTLLYPLPLAYFFVFFISLLVGVVVFFVGYYYPTMKIKNLRSRIDRALPFAVFYMATTASSGSHPLNIFRMLSLRGGVIGDEANRIYTNVKALGMDINTALQKAAARSPSEKFAELLWGMVSILTTGGNLEDYLRGRTATIMSHYRRSLADYAKTIALYTEIYITLIIVGTLFFIILLAIISPIVGGNTLFLQTFLVFFFIPLVSVGFIFLLKGASPTE